MMYGITGILKFTQVNNICGLRLVDTFGFIAIIA